MMAGRQSPARRFAAAPRGAPVRGLGRHGRPARPCMRRARCGNALRKRMENRLRLRVAAGWVQRLRGLLGGPPLRPHEGLWLVPCRAVHTFGMRRTIDVVFLDGRGRALKTAVRLRPNRIALCISAHSVVELPGGYCRRHPGYAAAILRALARR